MFNAAQSGAHSSDLQHELDYLLPKIQQQTSVNQSGWKMLNVFIGSNDLCAICEGGFRSPTEYSQNILAALERVRSTLSNVFVNLSKNSYISHWLTKFFN
jgi:phospholipase B1